MLEDYLYKDLTGQIIGCAFNKSLRAVPRSSQRVSRASVNKTMLRGKMLIDKDQRLWDLFRISCSVTNDFNEV